MGRRVATGVVLVVVLSAAVVSAQRLVLRQRAEYPAEWGPNVAAKSAGARILEGEGGGRSEEAEFLIDGDVTPGEPFWQVEVPRRGRPRRFVLIGWEGVRTIDRLAFYNDARLRGQPTKEVRVSFSIDGRTFTKPRSFVLKARGGVQSFEVMPPERARMMRIEVVSTYSGPRAVLEEVAAFEGSVSRARMFRGTAKSDVMILKNGDKLTGRVLNETIEIQTSYARLVFNREHIANIMFEGGAANIERITMINGDTFSGFILTKVIHFALENGQTVDIRKDKVNRLGMRLLPNEPRYHPRNDVIFLKNGDIFNGRVLNPSLTIKTSYATLTNRIADIARIEFTGDSKIVTKITLKNGNTMQGLLEEEDIEIDLDYGPTVLVYKDKIDRIEMRR